MISEKAFQAARIMIVDDEESNLRLLERILQRVGYSNLAALADSRNVLSQFIEWNPDLILLDLHMPHTDGFALMEQLRPLVPHGTYLPILVLTADVNAETKQRALSAGAKDFLTKPFDAIEVLLRIRNLLETRFLYLQLQMRAFLIADIRGYTRFTEEHGDEAAARLARTFASIARAGASAWGGEVIELRGDEALAVFGSARHALHAAVDLQGRFCREIMPGWGVSMPVGIGLDVGEAAPLEGGYRGRALNLAARLCSLAAPGEILASEGVSLVARHMDGLAYIDRGPVDLKGFIQPVRVIQVVSEHDQAPPDNVQAVSCESLRH